MGKILSLFLVLSLLPLDGFANMWSNGTKSRRWYGGKKYHVGQAGCYNEVWGLNIRLPRFRGHHKKKQPKQKVTVSECTKELTAKKQDMVDKVRNINDQITKILDNKYNKGAKIVKVVDDKIKKEEDEQTKDNSRFQTKIDLITEKSRVLKYKGGLLCWIRKGKDCHFGRSGSQANHKDPKDKAKIEKRLYPKINNLKAKKDEVNNDHNKDIQNLKENEIEIENEKLDNIIDDLSADMLAEYKKDPKAKLTIKTKNDPERLMTDVELYEHLFSDAGKRFVKKYLDNNLSELADLHNQRENILDQINNLEAYAKKICDKRNIACPKVREEFQQNPTKENFEKMIKTVTSAFLVEDEDSYYATPVDLTLDNVDKYLKSKKLEMDDKKKVEIKDNLVKSKAAWKIYEENQKNIKKNSSDLKKFEAACGGCTDLDRIMRDVLKEGGDPEEMLQLKNLYAQVGCEAPKELKKSCEEVISDALVSNGFKKEIPKDLINEKKSINVKDKVKLKEIEEKTELALLSGALNNTLANLSVEDKSSKFISLFKDLKSKLVLQQDPVSGEDYYKECLDCKLIDNQLKELSEPMAITKKVTDFDEEGKLVEVDMTRELIKPKSDLNEEGKKKFEYIKNLALTFKCKTEPEFSSGGPNCKEKTDNIKNFLSRNSSRSNLLPEEDTFLDSLLIDLADYEKNVEKKSCCGYLVDDLRPALSSKKDDAGRSFVDKSDLRFRVAEETKCVNCNPVSEPDEKPKQVIKKGDQSSCDFYSNNIKKYLNDPTHKIQGIYPEMTVAQYMQKEVFLCKEGAKNSQVKPVDNWTPSAYGEFGKYGDLSEFDLVCMNTPGEDGQGKTGVLSCCNVARDSAAFKEWQSKLSDPKKINAAKRKISTAQKDSPSTELEKFLNNEETENRAETFCNNVVKEYRNARVDETTSSWGYCNMINEQEKFITVDQEFYKSTIQSESMKFKAPSPASKATQE
jgi:hypothetical protein